MSAPHPPAPVSTRFLVALLAALVGVLVATGGIAWYLANRPILPAPDASPSRPIPASTAGPAPATPVELTERPVTGWGPR